MVSSRVGRRRLTALALAAMLCGGVVAAVRLHTPDLHVVPVARIGLDGAVRTDTPTAADPAGDGAAVCAPVSLAFLGPLSGDDAGLGADIRDGVRSAVDRHNTTNPGCQVQLKEFDTGADEQRSRQLAGDLVADVYTLGVVGPVLSDVVEATAGAFESAGLVTATASARRDALAERGRRTFFRGLAGVAAQGRAVANYLTATLDAATVCVTDDGTAFGTAMAHAVAATLGPAECGAAVGLADPDAAAQRLASEAPGAVFVGGRAEPAAQLSRRLRELGCPATVLTADFVPPAEPVDGSEGMLLSDPYGPTPAGFVSSHAAIGYDLATVMVRGIDAGALTRAQLVDWIHRYDGQGVTNHYAWDTTGELVDPTVWISRVEER
ncbi:branched-chain amino acid ABC transporter substrate-binding protein [Mycobacterium sp. MYCO198283]|uniref:branched-chain amino acid ABC transporter substrate-binding protein n=1 Tax=Mycobacterium sp. MYCO198283 TaxID=2883505 RepID=UPI001E46F57B|nr:branched-chain amino acid ABC transporter substrate-binding protein [Mycobacterium sp. MYCO198283]MCG5433472.1 branched-chain amino acid ABC transporter substrate-binding protein [Mycobacterium sp. MYCO198283]